MPNVAIHRSSTPQIGFDWPVVWVVSASQTLIGGLQQHRTGVLQEMVDEDADKYKEVDVALDHVLDEAESAGRGDPGPAHGEEGAWRTEGEALALMDRAWEDAVAEADYAMQPASDAPPGGPLGPGGFGTSPERSKLIPRGGAGRGWKNTAPHLLESIEDMSQEWVAADLWRAQRQGPGIVDAQSEGVSVGGQSVDVGGGCQPAGMPRTHLGEGSLSGFEHACLSHALWAWQERHLNSCIFSWMRDKLEFYGNQGPGGCAAFG
ncbi:hypothetical protein CYMTET_23518 [Cymbomonas tetramitiformis]|uniref:Uncharacterized protein n=1 Tax=Cymbomonas tetramitiformis TaxID=36881 RepID=A0AAE0FY89_9CHLO|nr:hypothetical protein CYMTET_23518 [Cymbomonas tetramitiformis]